MKVDIRTVNLDLDDRVQSYVREKIKGLEQLVEKFERQGELLARAEIGSDTTRHQHGNDYFVQVSVHLPNKTVVVREVAATIEEASDLVRDVLRREIVKHKGKVRTLMRKLMRRRKREKQTIDIEE